MCRILLPIMTSALIVLVLITNVLVVTTFSSSLSSLLPLLNAACTELVVSIRTLSLMGTMQSASAVQQSLSRSVLFVNAMIPPPNVGSWDWYDASYDSALPSSNETFRGRLLEESSRVSRRANLDLSYQATGIVLLVGLFWLVRGSVRVALENLCCCECGGVSRKKYVRLMDRFMLFPNPELFVLICVFPGLTKNVTAALVENDTASSIAIASLLLVFVVVPTIILVAVISFHTASRLYVEQTSHDTSMGTNEESSDTTTYLHVSEEQKWVDASSDDVIKTEYVARYGPIFKDYSRKHVSDLLPLLIFGLHVLEGIVYGVVDTSDPNAGLWSSIVLNIAQLTIFLSLCPLLIHVDNYWKIARCVLAIVVAFLTFSQIDRLGLGSSAENCEVVIIILWIALVSSSMLRILYVMWELTGLGLFYFWPCCPRVKEDRASRDAASTKELEMFSKVLPPPVKQLMPSEPSEFGLGTSEMETKRGGVSRRRNNNAASITSL